MYLFPPQTPEDALLERERAETMQAELQKLPPRQERILRLRFGFGGDEPHTLRAIAAKFGCGTENIRRLEGVALRRLQRTMRASPLIDHLAIHENFLRGIHQMRQFLHHCRHDAPPPTFDPSKLVTALWPEPKSRGRAVDTGEFVFVFAEDLKNLTADQMSFLTEVDRAPDRKLVKLRKGAVA